MNAEQLQGHADRIRSSQVLGRSELMLRLFDFLVSCSIEGRAPKEIELAIEVFGKDAQFEVTRDAMVRVYMHKLRRKLDEYYADAGHGESDRLTIPRGEYRLVFEEMSAEPMAHQATNGRDSDEPTSPAPLLASDPMVEPTRSWFSGPRLAIAAIAALLIANLAAVSLRWSPFSMHTDAQHTARLNTVWRQIVSDDKPIYLVMGDYYIFGELDAESPNEPYAVRRLVREFNVNSRNDFEQLLKDHPELSDRYMDVALSYLPVSSAYALRHVAPLLDSDEPRKRVQVIMSSDLTSGMVRSSHIVYVGLLSGMGILRDIAFSGSRFRIGDTYDELIDRKTDQMYVSQSSVSVNNNTRYRDYGYFATFAGPNDNRIVILSGTRDVALMHTAEAATHASSLKTLIESTDAAHDFEALYAVDAIDRMNLDGQLLLANRFNTANIWSSSTTVASASTNVAFHNP